MNFGRADVYCVAIKQTEYGWEPHRFVEAITFNLFFRWCDLLYLEVAPSQPLPSLSSSSSTTAHNERQKHCIFGEEYTMSLPNKISAPQRCMHMVSASCFFFARSDTFPRPQRLFAISTTFIVVLLLFDPDSQSKCMRFALRVWFCRQRRCMRFTQFSSDRQHHQQRNIHCVFRFLSLKSSQLW